MADSGKSSNLNKKRGLSTTHIILIAGFVVVVGLIVFLFFFMNKGKDDGSISMAAVGVIDELNYAEVMDEVDKKNAERFMTNMSTEWYFPSATAPSSSAVIGNSGRNVYPFYFTVALTDTGEEIYKSGLIPVGKSLKELVLDKKLEVGEYAATCTYHLIDDQNNNEEVPSSLVFNVRIIIQG